MLLETHFEKGKGWNFAKETEILGICHINSKQRMRISVEMKSSCDLRMQQYLCVSEYVGHNRLPWLPVRERKRAGSLWLRDETEETVFVFETVFVLFEEGTEVEETVERRAYNTK